MLDKPKLTADLKAMFAELRQGDNPERTEQQFADTLATIIDDYLKSATVNVEKGIAVQVTPASGTGATTAIGTGTIS